MKRRTASGLRRAVKSCGCRRRIFVLCDEGRVLWNALRDELPNAMWSGDWTHFDDLRADLEAHFSSRSTQDSEEDASRSA